MFKTRNKVNLINTGKAISYNVKKYLNENKIENNEEKTRVKIIISKKEEEFDKKAKNILKSDKKLDITCIC